MVLHIVVADRRENRGIWECRCDHADYSVDCRKLLGPARRSQGLFSVLACSHAVSAEVTWNNNCVNFHS